MRCELLKAFVLHCFLVFCLCPSLITLLSLGMMLGRQRVCFGCLHVTCGDNITVLKLCRSGFSLPASYGNLTSLVELTMANNKLVGSIPPSWDALAYNLSFLDLSENQLTGLPSLCPHVLLRPFCALGLHGG